MARVGLTEQAGRKVKELSGGMRQRLAIAAAVIAKPRFLLLDEPTVGLDPEQRASFRSLVRDLADQTRILLSTHIVEDATRMCSHVVILSLGQVRYDGPLGDLGGEGTEAADGVESEAERVEAAYLRAVSGTP